MNATKGNHGAHPGEASGDRDARAVQPGAYRAVESATRDRSDRATRIAWLLLVVAVVWLGIELAPEILDPPPAFNDHTLHLALVREASAALARGQDPTDFWFAPITEGYPLFRHYQHLPHVAMAGLYHLLGGAVPLETIFHVSMWLLLLAFPLSVAWSVARLCGDRRAGIFAGLAAAVLSTDHLFGFDLSSYGWAGSGMTSQLWGMVLLGPAWAVTHGALTGGRRLWLAAGLIAMLLVTHTVLGYVAALSLPVLLVAGGGPGFRVRMVRALVIAAVAGAAAAYFVVPFFLDRAAMNRSAWETASKYDSFGAATVLGWFLGGELFDHGLGASRVALITLLAGLGLLVSLLAYRARPTARPLVLLLGAWLLLYFGRPTWGVLLDALPFGRNLHLHRLIAARAPGRRGPGRRGPGAALAGAAPGATRVATAPGPGRPDRAALLAGRGRAPRVHRVPARLAGDHPPGLRPGPGAAGRAASRYRRPSSRTRVRRPGAEHLLGERVQAGSRAGPRPAHACGAG